MTTPKILGLVALAIAADLVAVSAQAQPVTCTPDPGGSCAIALQANTATLALPGGGSVYMWGFGPDAGTNTATVPGPVLRIPPGATTLVVTLRNNLKVPVSFVMPGQASPTDAAGALLAPTRRTTTRTGPDNSPGNTSGQVVSTYQRATSLTAEAAANGGTQTYYIRNLRPGTYLYESGSDMAVQVQMGLYGAAVADYGAGLAPGAGVAYAGVPYSTDTVLLFSELDPSVHTLVQAADGTATPVYGLPGVIEYRARYVLINGAAAPAGGALALPAGLASDDSLLRFLNAGLKSRVPEVLGGMLQLLAEDGGPYPGRKTAYSALLPAGKTIDAYLRSSGSEVALYDRAMGLSNAGAAGGALAKLSLGAAVRATVTDQAYGAIGDTALVVAAPGVLDGAVPPIGTILAAQVVAPPSHGTLVLAADGSFTYTPTFGFHGNDLFTFQAATTPGGALSNVGTATIQVTLVPHAPQAVADGVTGVAGAVLAVAAPGLLANDVDVDGVGMTASLASASSCPGDLVTTAFDGSFTYAATASLSPRVCSFTYRATRAPLPNLASAPATVTVTLVAPGAQPPVAGDDFAGGNAPGINTWLANPWAVSAAPPYGHTGPPPAPGTTPVTGGSIQMNQAVEIAVLANDYSPDGLPLAPASVRIGTRPFGTGAVVPSGTFNGGAASAEPLASGRIRFTPAWNFRGTDEFTYQVQDSMGHWSNASTVRVNVK